jgi:hypothetical protein
MAIQTDFTPLIFRPYRGHDIDRAKTFYSERAGFHVAVDVALLALAAGGPRLPKLSKFDSFRL